MNQKFSLFWASLLCLGLAVILLLVEELIASETAAFTGRSILLVSCHELGMALLIAFVLNLTIEYINRRSLQDTVDRIQRAVHQAVLQRSLPPEIFHACEKYIFNAELYRYAQRVRYTLEKVKNVPDSVSLTAKWSYHLKNITNNEATYPMTLSVYRNPKCPDKCAIDRVFINDNALSDEEMRELTENTPGAVLFRRNVFVKPGADVKLEMHYRQVHTGQQSFETVCTTQPAMDMHVDIYVPNHDFNVDCGTMHPENQVFADEHDGDLHFAWKLPSPALPGQGILFFWSPRVRV